MSLIDLLNRYDEQHSHRARGGLRAIAGFDFQLRSYLADFASLLAQDSEIQHAGQVFLEAFSDEARVEDDRVVCVQVKRTLTKTRLGEAAEEAVILDEFFEREASGLRDQIRFEVVGLAGKPDGSAPGWDGVQLPKDLEDRDNRQDRLARLLASGRLAQPRIDPDPWWRIIAATWTVLDDPFGFAREALDISLRRGLDPGDAERVRNDIAEAFLKRRRASHFPGQMLSAKDVEPFSHQTREVVLGQVPTLAHLRDGRFLDRPQHVVGALAELDRLVNERDWRMESGVYALWIEGRSGNGKSVLLLELMRQLVLDRGATVVWLDDASEQLLPLLEAWTATGPDASDPCYVFVDDFYSPNKRAEIGFPEIARLMRQHDRADWPVLVTCGAPEQRQEWKASGNDEAFRASQFLLPPVQPDERDRLSSWFRDRTGEEAKAGTAFEEDQGLMISMMFELREGEMREFGRRFRSRLEDEGLTDALTVVLALNRLYIWAPGEWLDESQSDALRRLNGDHDFSILTLKGRPGEYVRITHPHLSNAIYQAVRERDDEIVQARDLQRAFLKSLESDANVAQLILYRIAHNNERLSTLDQEELARGMTQAWLDVVKRGALPAQIDLATAWTNWAVWTARQPNVGELLADNPLERAREAVHAEHRYWSTLWRRLWSCNPGYAGLVSDGERWLASHQTEGDRQWSFIWEILFRYKSETNQDVNALITNAIDWLRANDYEPDWNFVLRPIAAAAPEQAPWSSALRLLDEFPQNRNWAYVFQIVTSRADRFEPERRTAALRAGWEWVRDSRSIDTPEWSYVWRRLVELRSDLPAGIESSALLRLGYELLGRREERAEWTYVWERLVELRSELPADIEPSALLSFGYEWLGGKEERAEWSYVWQILIELRGDLPTEIASTALLSLGYEWLAGNEERAEWTHVWERLVALRGDLPSEIESGALLRVGYEWLRGREERAEWNYVWQKLVELLSDLPTDIQSNSLLSLGYEWLAGREERAEWDPIWEASFRGGYRDAAFLAAGSDWILEHSALPQTNGLAEHLLSAASERSGWSAPRELIDWVRDWLNSNRNHGSWSWLWGRLWAIERTLETARLAIPWLTSGARERAAQFVIGRLVRSRNLEIIAELEAWLDSHSDHPLADTVRSTFEDNT